MISEIFSCRLRELARKLTLQNIGDAVKTTRHTIGNLENGRKPPSLDMVIAIADFFDVSVDYLIGRSEEPMRR